MSLPLHVNLFRDWLTDWLSDWLTEWLSDWLSEWLSEWLTDWVSDWVTDWLSDWLTDWLSEWVSDWLSDWLTDWLLRHLIHVALLQALSWHQTQFLCNTKFLIWYSYILIIRSGCPLHTNTYCGHSAWLQGKRECKFDSGRDFRISEILTNFPAVNI